MGNNIEIKLPTAAEFLRKFASQETNFRGSHELVGHAYYINKEPLYDAMESFASLARENERQKWELKNEILLAQVKTLETIIEFQKLQINNGK